MYGRTVNRPAMRHLRLSRRLTQRQLAERVGKSERLIRYAEAGYRQPSATVIDAICEVLGCNIDDITVVTVPEVVAS